MADKDRMSTNALAFEKALEKTPYYFDFFQAIRRFEGAYPEKSQIGTSQHIEEDPIRLAQEPSLAFAPSTLSAFAPRQGKSPPRLSVLFFGLFGPNGPLPLHLSEYARDRLRNADDPTFSRFADMFHHRMLSLFYRAWANAQPAVNFDRREADRFSVYVASLFGLGMPAYRHRSGIPDLAMLHFAGRYACQTRNPEGLCAILKDFFGVPVEIEEFIGQWIEIPEQDRCHLAKSLETGVLGDTITIGSHLWVCDQKFRIVMGPMDFNTYERLFPGGRSLKRLQAFVKGYIGDELDWDVRLILKKEDVPPIKLEETRRLGWTTWLSPDCLTGDVGDLCVSPFENTLHTYT